MAIKTELLAATALAGSLIGAAGCTKDAPLVASTTSLPPVTTPIKQLQMTHLDPKIYHTSGITLEHLDKDIARIEALEKTNDTFLATRTPPVLSPKRPGESHTDRVNLTQALIKGLQNDTWNPRESVLGEAKEELENVQSYLRYPDLGPLTVQRQAGKLTNPDVFVRALQENQNEWLSGAGESLRYMAWKEKEDLTHYGSRLSPELTNRLKANMAEVTSIAADLDTAIKDGQSALRDWRQRAAHAQTKPSSSHER